MKRVLLMATTSVAIIFSTLHFCTLHATAEDSGAPSKTIIEEKLKALWERKADPGMDGAKTVTVHSVQIGEPRAWTRNDGNGGRYGTKVYPAKVHWTLRTHYRTRTRVQERRWIMSCFKNTHGDWVVQQSGATGQTETSRDEAPASP